MSSDTAVAQRRRLRVSARAIVLGGIVLALGVSSVAPIRHYLEQRAEIAGLEREVELLEAERERLERRIEQLQDPSYVERLARECLGMVKPGEIRFVVSDESRSAPAAC